MKVFLVWLFLAIFCRQELNAASINRNSRHQNHSRCFRPVARTTTATLAPCTATWTEFDGVLTTIAPHIAFEIRGIEDCKRACLRTIPGCVAIDVYPNITLCIYHLRPISELALNRYTALKSGYKQLVLNRTCSSGSGIKTETAKNDDASCTRQWTVTPDVHSPGYHTHLGVYGEEACKKDCLDNIPGCVGIELLRQFDSCNYFIQSVEELIKSRVPMEGNTQQILTRECHPVQVNSNKTDQPIQPPSTTTNFTYNVTSFDVCSAKWTKVPDVFSILYHRHPNTDGLEACQKACFEIIPECVAISVPEIDEIPLNRGECMYFIEPLSQVIKSRMPFKGYSQYVLSRECTSNSSVSNNETETDDQLLLRNETIVNTNKTSKQECTWEEHNDTYSLGAALYAGVLGIEACKLACAHTITDCVAVDDHRSSFCWYHKNQSNVESMRQSYTGEGFIQYVRVCSAERETTYNNYTLPQL